MEIILGYYLDSKVYPDELHNTNASIGKVITGFHGLVNLLEIQLGQNFPDIAESVRIAEWQATISKIDNGKKPYSASFQTDSWNTARELKNRRDELVLAGWNPTIKGGGKWIDALAEIELANSDFSKGLADRVRNVMELLKQQILPLSIQKISVVDEDESLWDPWATELVQLLKQNGVSFEKMPLQEPDIPEEPTTDLEKIKTALYSSKDVISQQLTKDGSFLIVKSEQEWDAADYFMSWLQLYGDENTVLINESNNLLLTELFHRRGLPSSDLTEYSKWRSALQVLPLTIETYWKPIRIHRMMELLTLPASPLPKKLCFKLARILSEEPGIGGDRWNEAIEAAKKELEEQWIQEEPDSKKRAKRKADLQEKIDLWINHDYYDPMDGIPCDILENICRQVSKWAFNRHRLEPNSIFVQAYTTANELIEGLKKLDVKKINQLQLANILDSVLGDGSKLDGYREESTSWTTVQQAGSIWGQAQNVIWWNFVDNSSTPLKRWSDAEREFLLSHDIYLPTPDQERRRENRSWYNALRFAEEKVILFIPSKIRGVDTKAHPLLDEIRYALSKMNADEQQLTIDPAVLRKDQYVEIVDSTFTRLPLENKELPGPIRTWRVPPRKLMLREKESATSFESLISCPLQWTFKYGANIRPSNTLSLPNESVMLGNLGHAILERLIQDDAFSSDTDIQQITGELFNEFVPKMAAVLLLPENQSLLRKVRRDLQKSMHQFGKFLEYSGITIIETEQSYSKKWHDGVDFEGRLDLVGRTKSGRKVLFDAKWSRRPANYKARLEDGSVQLSLYHWLLSSENEELLPVAYFILSSGDFFAVPDDEIPEQYHVEGVTMHETLQNVQNELSNVSMYLMDGYAFATGIEEEGAEEPIFKPVCSFCEYQDLCGVRR